MAEFKNHIRRGVHPRWEVSLELYYLSPMLQASPKEAVPLRMIVEGSMKRVRSLLKVFKMANRSYMDKVKEHTNDTEENNDHTIRKCDALREVEI